ncbi:MAG: peptide chain release factor N(5)-glutamine methyltransferase [Acidobacteriaceae bacterium]|nr:peptide chain release factor N(5)-glutamine methyltransferase [Acidobacteriaceae bacterium]
MTVREATTEAVVTLEAAGVSARDAQVLLGHVLQRERAWVLAHADDAISLEELETLRALTARRATREPLQYILGVQEFYGMEFAVTPAVLIPRPETELLVEAVELWATQRNSARTLQIVDVGTGSGAIAVTLATHVAGVRLTAVDISPRALEVAKANARTHSADRRIDFLENDLLTGMNEGIFDCVVSNPPYVPQLDLPTMQPEVTDHEPHLALFAGDDGLAVYRRLIPQAAHVLPHGGLLAMEFGFGQREAIAELLKEWSEVRFLDDLAGIPRHVLAVRPRSMSEASQL